MTTKCTTNQMYPRKLAITDLSDGYTTAIIAVAPGEIEVELSHDGQLLSWHASETEARAAKNDHRYDAIASSAVVVDPTPDYNDDAGWQRIADDAHGVPPSPEVAAETEAAIEAAVIERQLADARAAYREARDRGDTSAIQRWTTIGLALIARRDGVAAGPLVEPDGVPRPEGGPGGDPPPDRAAVMDALDAAIVGFALTAAGDDPDGRILLTQRRRAAVKALDFLARGGALPYRTPRGAVHVASRTRSREPYRVTAAGCDCAAGSVGTVCWHAEIAIAFCAATGSSLRTAVTA